MALGGEEIFLSSIIGLIGLIGNLKLFIIHVGKNEQIKWNFSIYGIAILIVIVGLFTPPDLISNILFSAPLAIIYLLILRKFGFKWLQIKMDGETEKE